MNTTARVLKGKFTRFRPQTIISKLASRIKLALLDCSAILFLTAEDRVDEREKNNSKVS